MTFPEMIHGKKPETAPFIPTDPLAELRKLLSGEISDWPQITQLSDLFQNYMLDAYSNAGLDLRGLIGQGGEDTSAILKAAEPLIRGEIPKDVASQVYRSSAFQSLGAGTLGGPMGSALTARNLGLTSLDLMNQGTNMATQGTNAAQRWQQIASGTILDPSKQLYSPEWFSTFMAQQRAAKQATQQLKYNVAAAPDPVISGISGTIMNLLGAYLGAGRGGGGGGMLQTNQGMNYNQFASTSAGQAGMTTPQWQGQVGQLMQDPSYQQPLPLQTQDPKTMMPPQTSYFNYYPTWT